MPKIIENPESRLIGEARKQMAEAGYGAMTVRSVAKACGVGVGTVYNYFPSKDALAAACMLEDWRVCMDIIREMGGCSESPEPVARSIHEQLIAYSDAHQMIFRDEAAAGTFAGSFSRYHGLLRRQLAIPLRKFCSSDFASEFIAEALLTWTMAGKNFDEIYGMIGGLF